ncbi:MAG: hypothetical protein ABIU97_08850 [Dehalococcoidia bacterium]
MTRLLRNLRPLLVGAVALFLTAGIAFAARPATTGAGTETGTQASGQQELNSRDATEADEDQGTPEVDTDTESETKADGTASDNADHCNIDLTSPAAIAAAPNHGAVVCSAAQQKTFPGTFKNHGAWVSSFAHKDHSANASATGKLKSADAKANAAAKSNGHSHSGSSTAH